MSGTQTAALAVALIAALIWLAIAAIHRLRTAAARCASHMAELEAARHSDSNELLYIDLTSTDLDAELRTLIKENGQ